MNTVKTVSKAVYIHRDSNTNIPFYVGCGNSETRPTDMRMRSPEWKEYVAINGLPIVEIVSTNLNCKQGTKLENETIKKYGIIKEGGILVNSSSYSIGVKVMKQATKNKISKAVKGVKKGPQSIESIEKRVHMIKVQLEDVQPIINEITERLLNQESALIVDEDIAIRYNVSPKTIRNIRNRQGGRYSKFPKTVKMIRGFKKNTFIEYTEEHRLEEANRIPKRKAKRIVRK